MFANTLAGLRPASLHCAPATPPESVPSRAGWRMSGAFRPACDLTDGGTTRSNRRARNNEREIGDGRETVSAPSPGPNGTVPAGAMLAGGQKGLLTHFPR